MIILDHDLTAQNDRDRPAYDFCPFVRGVVATVMQICMTDSAARFRVPDRQIGVRADGDRAFLRIKPIGLGMVRGCQRNKTIDIDPPFDHTFGKQDRQTGFNAGNPIWDMPEGAFTIWLFLAFSVVKAEWAMIRGKQIENTGLQSFPARLLFGTIAWGW